MKDNIKAFSLVGLVLLFFVCAIFFTDSNIVVEEQKHMLAWNRAMTKVLSEGNFGCEREFAVLQTHESCVRKATTYNEMRKCIEQAKTDLALANKQCEDGRLSRMIAYTLQNAKKKRNWEKTQ